MAIIPKQFDNRRSLFSEIKGPVTTFFLNTVAGGGSTSSATFVDYPGPIDKVITKRETATALFVSGVIGAFAGANLINVTVGLRINSVDYTIGSLFFNQIGVHLPIPFTIPIASGLLAGQYTARVRWRTSLSSVSADGNDRVQIRFDEGYFQ